MLSPGEPPTQQPELVSFITPVCNQGDEARLTIASAKEAIATLPHEVIVVDDHSIDGSCHAMPRDVLIVRTERREGVSSARRCGFAQSRGDVLIWSDPHCRFPSGSLYHLVQSASAQEAVIQPRIVPVEHARARHGGRLTLGQHGVRVARAWRRPAPCPGLLGTIYVMQRKVYERLGGWPKLPGVWGYSEEAMSLMAWYLGVPIVVDSRFICIHKAYRPNKRRPYDLQLRDRASNAHFVHAAFFPQYYTVFWRPRLEKLYGADAHDPLCLQSRDFQRLRRHIAKYSVRTEQQFYQEVLGIEMPPAL